MRDLKKIYSALELYHFFVCTDYSYSDFSIFHRYANSKELTSVFFFLNAFSRRSFEFSGISSSYSILFRRPPNFTSLCPERVPSLSFLLHSELHLLRCIVVNHNFKLKPSETSVTNDAELFNYALKSTRENVGSAAEEEESLFIMLLFAGLLLVIRC